MKLQAQLAPVPFLGPGGQRVVADGLWELKFMEKQLVFHGTLFCFMVFRKCSAMEEQFLWIKDSGPAAECVL